MKKIYYIACALGIIFIIQPTASRAQTTDKVIQKPSAVSAKATKSWESPTKTLTNRSSITINVRDADIQDVVDLIALQAGINVVLDGSVVTRKVTMKLSNVPLKTVLNAMSDSYGLQTAWKDNVLHIGAPDAINRAFPNTDETPQRVFDIANADPDFIATALKSILQIGSTVVSDTRSGRIFVKGTPATIASAAAIIETLDLRRQEGTSYKIEAVPLSNVTADAALTALKSSLPITRNQSYTANNHPNAITLSGSPDFIANAKGILFNIDKPGQQVRFMVRVTDITPLNTSKNIGVILGGVNASGAAQPGNGSTITTFLANTIGLNATLNFLQTQGRASILAEPSIITLNNEKATLKIGENYPVPFFNPQTGQNTVQFIPAGVNLDILPIIGNDGTITVVLNTDYSQILSFVSSYPVVGSRSVQSTMRVGNDQTIVIAGLYSDITSDTMTKVPFLGDVPIFGSIFRNRQSQKTKDEIVFLVTPHILTAEDSHPATSIQR